MVGCSSVVAGSIVVVGPSVVSGTSVDIGFSEVVVGVSEAGAGVTVVSSYPGIGLGFREQPLNIKARKTNLMWMRVNMPYIIYKMMYE